MAPISKNTMLQIYKVSMENYKLVHFFLIYHFESEFFMYNLSADSCANRNYGSIGVLIFASQKNSLYSKLDQALRGISNHCLLSLTVCIVRFEEKTHSTCLRVDEIMNGEQSSLSQYQLTKPDIKVFACCFSVSLFPKNVCLEDSSGSGKVIHGVHIEPAHEVKKRSISQPVRILLSYDESVYRLSYSSCLNLKLIKLVFSYIKWQLLLSIPSLQYTVKLVSKMRAPPHFKIQVSSYPCNEMPRENKFAIKENLICEKGRFDKRAAQILSIEQPKKRLKTSERQYSAGFCAGIALQYWYK
ncbi:hypothetical protein WN51_00854 [Melipona quadrifasciata]|uniref:Uncharacterized protein n=1 Tax=Melipona quadrifasciata TaxID=166423 RepID=A0A0M9ACB6_9HYME|nr:hypothetical protein WN51_00854 [Melipona quadrifasciata]